MKTLVDYFNSVFNKYKEKECLVFKKEYRTERFTYERIYLRAKQFSSFLEKKGLKKGDRVLIYAYNCPEWVIAYFGCIISGIIVVPVDFNSTNEFVRGIMNRVMGKLLICSKYKSLQLKDKEVYIEDFDLGNNKIKEPIAVKEDDIVEIMFTSGTTSAPKGVVLTHKNIISNVKSITKLIYFDNYRLLSFIPLSHMFEQTIGLLAALYFGSTIVYTASRKSTFVVETMQEEKIRGIVTAPILLKVLKEKVERQARERGKDKAFRLMISLAKNYPKIIKRILLRGVIKKLGKLNLFIVGGAALEEEVEEFWNNLGIDVLQGYGLTETSPVLSFNTFTEKRKGSTGRIIPGVEVKIASGEIWIKGDNVFRGYYQNNEATKEAFHDGWFKTGDIGEIKDNFLYIKGRKKNMILSSSGMNVYPEDIENVLSKIQGVKGSCVLGVKREDIIITAVLILDKGADPKKAIEKANEKLASHQQIQDFYVWKKEHFPMTSTLKVIRRAVEEEIMKKPQKERRDDKRVMKENRLHQSVAEFAKIPIGRIKDNTSLVLDLKLDSLARVELSSILEEKFDIEFDESFINQKTTIKDLEQYIEKQKLVMSKFSFKQWALYPIIIFARSILQGLLFPVLKIFAWTNIHGRENVGKEVERPIIFIANHTSHFDAPVILWSLPRKVRRRTASAAAADTFFEDTGGLRGKIKKWALSYITTLIYNAYPFSREGSIKKSLKYTGKLIDKGWNIIIFPEGGRSLDGKMRPFKTGIGLIVEEMKADIIPIKIDGNYDVLPKGNYFPKPHKVRVTIGKKIIYEELKGRSYIDISKILEERVREI